LEEIEQDDLHTIQPFSNLKVVDYQKSSKELSLNYSVGGDKLAE
jgi:hypothetical protein